jgi:putative membrane protein
MSVEDPAGLRNMLANDRTLLAYIRTALSFAGIGFAVAKFGLSPKMTHLGDYLGIFMVLVGLLVIVIGFVQHRAVVRQVGMTSRERVTRLAAPAGCVLVCALLAIYLAASA